MRKLYSVWGGFVFLSIFLILLPFFLILLIKENWKRHSWLLNKIWARAFFALCLIPIKIKGQENLPDHPAVFCANHFSYLDIPTMGLVVNRPFVFVGKSSISKVPVFGYMFRKFHITVNRESLRDKYITLNKCQDIVSKRYSVIIFPEGGIMSQNPPRMVKLKEGAFRLAIEKQIPVVPVTIKDNWIILPDDGKFHLHNKTSHIEIHTPISTRGMKQDDIDRLMEFTYSIIHSGLVKDES
jgi:1-acyl-sn-glycerol-3-phosphate acyltransferase